MRRDLALALILGCLLVLLLEAPAVVREVGRDLRGPYAGWDEAAVAAPATPATPAMEWLAAERAEPVGAAARLDVAADPLSGALAGLALTAVHGVAGGTLHALGPRR